MRDGWRNAEEIFNVARTIASGAGRTSYLAEACAGNSGLLERVEALLRAFDAAGEFLDGGDDQTRVATASSGSSWDGPGAMVGPYKLLQVIGEGGFGTVYMAEQEHPVRRRVALKIVKLGMDTRQVVARFEQERQALATMDHPNIAKVFDAGATQAGRPFFVMELCTGEPVTRYCDRHGLTIRERLELMVQVCHAVQHAHQKGIIHRDLKPTNILVATQDGRPFAKVIDFGIAKATASKLTEKTLFTEHRQFIGTPQYMSPEQAQGSMDIDTRSDVYSLGVLMYELLTGQTPFDEKRMREEAYGEIQRIIQEVEPPLPSTRVSRGSSTLATVAASRRTEPSKLGSLLRGELDWVVMKAIEKDRARRYDTANGLAADIGRYLSSEAVVAAPPRLGYRMRVMLRRNRVLVITVAAIVAALSGGLIAAVVGLDQARKARDQAVESRMAESTARTAAETQRARADRTAQELRQSLYISQIARVQHLIEAGGTERVGPLLAACDPQLRGWEWNRLNRLADRSQRTLQAHTSINWYHGTACEYSPDGLRFLTFGDQKVLRIWDARTMSLLMEKTDPQGQAIQCAAWSADGRHVVYGTYQSLVKVIDSTNGEQLMARELHASACRAVTFNRAGTLIAAGTWNEPTIVMKFPSGEPVAKLEGPLARGEALAFNQDGSLLLIGSLDNDVSIVETSTWKARFSRRGSAFVVLDATISHDGTKVVSLGEDSRLWMRDVRTGTLLFAVSTTVAGVSSVAFDPSDSFVAVGCDEGLLFFDARTGERLEALTGHTEPVEALSFDPGGRFLLSIDRAGTLKQWHLGAMQPVSTFTSPGILNDVVYLKSGLIALATTDQGARLIDPRTLEVVNHDPQPVAYASDLAASPDGAWFAATGRPGWQMGGETSTCMLFDGSGRLVRQWRNQGGTGSHFFTSDSHVLASNDEAGKITFRDVDSGQVLRVWNIPAGVTCVIGGEDRSTVVAGASDGSVSQIRIDTDARVRTLPASTRPNSRLLLSAANDTLISYSDSDHSITVWNWRAGTVRFTCTSDAHLQKLSISPDGTRLVGACDSLTLPMWDLSNGMRVFTVGKHGGTILAVAFSPDGTSIASCGADHLMRLWETGASSTLDLDQRFLRQQQRWKVRREVLWEEDATKAKP